MGQKIVISDLELKAQRFAEIAHQGQVRRYTNEPYIVHPGRVAELVREVLPYNSKVLAAAWLHDVVEDCGVSIETLDKEFGLEVAQLVWALTDVSKPKDGNRAIRKALDRAHIVQASATVKTIKLADILDNMQGVILFDPLWAKQYVQEKKLLLPCLKEGDAGLWIMADKMIRDFQGNDLDD